MRRTRSCCPQRMNARRLDRAGILLKTQAEMDLCEAEPRLQVEGEGGFLVGEEVPAEAVEDAAFDGGDGDAVEGEGGFLVGEEVPAEAVEDAAFDGGDGDAFVGKFFRLPGLAFSAPGEDGVVGDEEKKILSGERANLQHWPVGNHGEALGGCGGEDVSIDRKRGA